MGMSEQLWWGLLMIAVGIIIVMGVIWLAIGFGSIMISLITAMAGQW